MPGIGNYRAGTSSSKMERILSCSHIKIEPFNTFIANGYLILLEYCLGKSGKWEEKVFCFSEIITTLTKQGNHYINMFWTPVDKLICFVKFLVWASNLETKEGKPLMKMQIFWLFVSHEEHLYLGKGRKSVNSILCMLEANFNVMISW